MTKEEFKEIQKEIGFDNKKMGKLCGLSEGMIKMIRMGKRKVSKRIVIIIFMYKKLGFLDRDNLFKLIDLS